MRNGSPGDCQNNDFWANYQRLHNRKYYFHRFYITETAFHFVITVYKLFVVDQHTLPAIKPKPRIIQPASKVQT